MRLLWAPTSRQSSNLPTPGAPLCAPSFLSIPALLPFLSPRPSLFTAVNSDVEQMVRPSDNAAPCARGRSEHISALFNFYFPNVLRYFLYPVFKERVRYQPHNITSFQPDISTVLPNFRGTDLVIRI